MVINEAIKKDYDEFILQNRIRVNGNLNIVLWLFIFTGPAIASGIKAGIFPDITYQTCVMISLIVAFMSLVHRLLYKRWPKAMATGLFALTALDILLVYMKVSHVSIYLTWFLVPLLSLCYCDKVIYYYAVILNFLLMIISSWISAPYQASLRIDYNDKVLFFRDVTGGYTIETLILMASSIMIGRLIIGYFRDLFEQKEIVRRHEKEMEEQMEILQSMVGIYDNVNLIDFTDNTEMSLRDEQRVKHEINMMTQTNTKMSSEIFTRVVKDQQDAFLEYTNIKTIRARLSQKKIVSADFLDVVNGWFRAQYITVNASIDGIPNEVIFTTRNVDEEKRREEHLIRISMTDEMTRLFNRRSYEDDLAKYRANGIEDDFVLFSVDVNGLKTVNDTKGHAAGDELIKGTADCLSFIVGNRGKAYRTGGDEFMAVIHTREPEDIRCAILNKSNEWRGVYSDELSVSVGYASYHDYPSASIDDLEHAADADMYTQKNNYYKENGLKRRGEH